MKIEKESKKVIKELQKEFSKVSKSKYYKLRIKSIAMSIITVVKGLLAIIFLVLVAKFIVWLWCLI